MQTALPLACFLSVIRPPGVQFEEALLQTLPVNKAKCPFVRDGSDVGFWLYTRHNPTVYQELKLEDDEALFASHFNFHDPTVFYFTAWMESPNDGSALRVRESLILRGDTNVIVLDISRLEAGPWYFTAAENTWYIGNFAAKFIDYMVTRGLNLNTTHLIGHSLGGQSAGVAGHAIKSGKVSRITGLDPALPLFAGLPLSQRLDPSDGQFVDVIHTDSGIFGYNVPIGHADFYPNGGISPQPGCQLEVVLHEQRLLNKYDINTPQCFYVYHLTTKKATLVEKLLEFFTYINSINNLNSEQKFETSASFKDTLYENARKSLPKLAALRKEKLLKHNKDKKAINKKSTLIDKLHNFNDRIDKDTLTQNDDATDYTVTKNTNIMKETKLENDMKVEIARDSIETDTPYIREKRVTNQDDLTATETTIHPETTNIHNEENMNVTSAIPEVYNAETVKIDAKYDTKETSPTNAIKDDTNSFGSPTISINDDIHSFEDSALNNHSSEIQLFESENEDKTTIKDTNYNKTNINEDNITTNKLVTTPTLQNIKDNPVITNIKLQDFKITEKLTNVKSNIKLPRKKRFISWFRGNENENFLFRMLDFLVKNRKNVLPVVTVMREINTLVKSANGELSHVSKENNNFIGGLPTLTPIKYDLELGESGIVSFVKRLLGLTPRGGKLTISGNK